MFGFVPFGSYRSTKRWKWYRKKHFLSSLTFNHDICYTCHMCKMVRFLLFNQNLTCDSTSFQIVFFAKNFRVTRSCFCIINCIWFEKEIFTKYLKKKWYIHVSDWLSIFDRLYGINSKLYMLSNFLIICKSLSLNKK